MRIRALLAIIALAPLTSACVVSTLAGAAADVATLPVKVLAGGIDMATTSQAEADQKRGRELRKQEEAAGKAMRKWEKACQKAQEAGQSCPPPPYSTDASNSGGWQN